MSVPSSGLAMDTIAVVSTERHQSFTDGKLVPLNFSYSVADLNALNFGKKWAKFGMMSVPLVSLNIALSSMTAPYQVVLLT